MGGGDGCGGDSGTGGGGGGDGAATTRRGGLVSHGVHELDLHKELKVSHVLC